jgi:Glycosyl transferases, related to UDP-glucuronosyltransferase
MDEFKSLKVVCIVVNAYGHFIPILNCAKALKEKGHDVTILTNGDEGFKKKA